MKNTLWIVGLNLALLFSTVTAVAQTNITQVKITPVKRDKSSSDFITAFGKNLIRSTGLMMLERANYPDGVQKSATKKECQPFMFENELINSESPQIFSKKVKQLFAKCESTWRNLNTPGLLGLLEFSNAEYDFSKNEKINAIEFQFANGFHLKGYIAVQDEQVKRPWVIIKCGVFCAATESGSMRNFMMNLFDESPFNIIILGNRTGDDFIKENQTVSVVGLYESADFYAVADYGHSVTSSILRSFILNQSKEYQKENSYKAQSFSTPHKILGYGETHLRQIWFTKVNDSSSYLRFEIFNQSGENCFASQAEQAPVNCRKVKTYKVKLKDLPVQVNPPKTIEQTYIINRYLNSHLKLFNEDVPLELSELEPNKITWKLYN